MTNITFTKITKADLEDDGTFAMQFSDFDPANIPGPAGDRIAYVESDYLGVGGFYIEPQSMKDVHENFFDCAMNQREGDLSEFIIPAPDGADFLFYYAVVGDPEK